MIIYYKVVEEWCSYPFKNVIDRRYCIFSKSKRNFKKGQYLSLELDSDTSIREKEKFLMEQLHLKKVEVIKLKN